ncbi:HAMP domain-containing histidine kinase [Bacillus timonensis]|uniref:histidine kinase n=1 Tax=Bacillus timonensis TaxID=1033734 RepID=A0A4S3PT78_9BACI|nr:sensor histidine kinase [Bacillus timonensis]THE12967.1 HAMP domain-containing histidine kinase [Bacillus timonensis]
MIKKFLVERRSWILFFCIVQGLILLIGYLDSTLSFRSILYIVFVFFVIFTLFLVIRYNREFSFYQNLDDWDPIVGIDSLQEGKTPFEKMVESTLKQQHHFYLSEISRHATSVEQEKDELLSWIHEVKTPLTTMKLMIERVEDNKLKEQLMSEWLRVHLLLDQQLHQRRIPFMENDLFIEKVDLEKLLIPEIQSLKSWCFQKRIGFDMSFEVSEVYSDGKWLQFILRQILTNAVKYSENADIEIRSYQKNETVILEIQDYGRGIKEKDLSRIFEKGFTSTTDHRDHAATGMGLYLTKNATKPLKIHIDVQSTYGGGTIFTLTFPRKNDFLKLTSM